MQGYVMDRPVLAQTGIEGRYDFDWTGCQTNFSFRRWSKGAARAG